MDNQNNEIAASSSGLEELDDEEEYEMAPVSMWDYLQTDKGHDIANRLVTIAADIKSTATQSISSERTSRLSAEISLRKFQHWVQLGVFIVAGTLTAFLSFYGKLEPSVSMLLGTMVGYFFGKGKT